MIVKTKMPDKKLELIIDSLEKRVSVLEKQIKTLSKGSVTKPKTTREPSEYNKFMSQKSKEIKIKHPDWKQPDVMKEVAKLWRAQK